MSTALSLLKVENEDNALLCIKIIIDGFRSHKVSRFDRKSFVPMHYIEASPMITGANRAACAALLESGQRDVREHQGSCGERIWQAGHR